MNHSHGQPTVTTRRNALRMACRFGGLTALTCIAGWLGRHGQCAVTGPCGGCPHVTDCALPKAKSARNPAPEATSPDPPHHG